MLYIPETHFHIACVPFDHCIVMIRNTEFHKNGLSITATQISNASKIFSYNKSLICIPTRERAHQCCKCLSRHCRRPFYLTIAISKIYMLVVWWNRNNAEVRHTEPESKVTIKNLNHLFYYTNHTSFMDVETNLNQFH